MSYDIYIGNAELESEWPGEYGPVAEWVVRGMSLPEAPFKPDMTQRGNSCHPGYGQWGEFCRRVGLETLFQHPEEGLLREHPGIQPLTAAHVDVCFAARTAFQAQHPDEIAGACQCAECQRPFGKSEDAPHDPRLNFDLLRLDWLCFWTRWTLDNCERPAVMNR